MAVLITPAVYARRRGVSREAVGKAIRTGRITFVADATGRKMIDPEVADIQWKKNTDPLQSARASVGRRGQGSPDGDSGAESPYWDARSRREQSEAAISEMKQRQMAGELCDVAGVHRAASTMGRAIRDSVMGVPTRIAPELAHVSDAWEIEQRLSAALRQVLDDAAKMAVDDLARTVGAS